MSQPVVYSRTHSCRLEAEPVKRALWIFFRSPERWGDLWRKFITEDGS
jgi:hypothetical protein